ncbi:MAG: aromatic amino acid lyase, partial [Candidatus Eisenbacteria sp.]|nr:aromatic amino acid lyase [Candidatus Eisenbacteria bacterium]
MAISITGKGLTVDDVVAVARRGDRVELHPDAVSRIKKCRDFIEERIEAGEIMYGVNTGIGEFSEVVLDDNQVEDFQRYLIYNHAAGIGKPCPIEHVRGAMVLRVNVLANGNSGCRLEIAQTFIDMLNKGVTPVVCEK